MYMLALSVYGTWTCLVFSFVTNVPETTQFPGAVLGIVVLGTAVEGVAVVGILVLGVTVLGVAVLGTTVLHTQNCSSDPALGSASHLPKKRHNACRRKSTAHRAHDGPERS
jgi:hypothetical protein